MGGNTLTMLQSFAKRFSTQQSEAAVVPFLLISVSSRLDGSLSKIGVQKDYVRYFKRFLQYNMEGRNRPVDA